MFLTFLTDSFHIILDDFKFKRTIDNEGPNLEKEICIMEDTEEVQISYDFLNTHQ